MDWNTAWRLARHPYIETFKFLEEGVFRFRLKDGFYIYDQAVNAEDNLGDVCFITLATDCEEEFHKYMDTLVITEGQRFELGIENNDADIDAREAWWDDLMTRYRKHWGER